MRTFAISCFPGAEYCFEVHEVGNEPGSDYLSVAPLGSFRNFADAQAFSAMQASATGDLRFSYYTQEEAHAAQHAQGVQHDHFDNGETGDA